MTRKELIALRSEAINDIILTYQDLFMRNDENLFINTKELETNFIDYPYSCKNSQFKYIQNRCKLSQSAIESPKFEVTLK